MTGPDADLTEVFRDEAAERLDEMDAALMTVEAGEAGPDTVDALFRNAHTIKGAAGMLGFDDVRTLAHAAEDVFGAIREAGVFPPELPAILLRTTSALRALASGAGEPIDGLLAELAAARESVQGGGPGGPGPAPGGAGAAPGGAGAARPAARRDRAKPARGGKETAEPARAGKAAAKPARAGKAAAKPARAGKAAAKPARARKEAARPARAEKETAGPAGPGEAAGPPRSVQAAAAPPSAQPAAAPPSAQPAATGQAAPGVAGADRRTLRVPAAKIDHLLDVVGEVMQDRRRLAHSLAGDTRLPPDAAEALGAGDRMLDELKDTAVGLRTLPLASIAGPLPRAVRDLARDAGKDVEFVITGGETELDRVILESLSEPLVHLLRNAVGHGIEPLAERSAAGKPARGRIELRAVPRGSLVEIVVADDGRGVPPEVATEARREGSLTDILTRPGYTTAAEVTDVAGRGVGLDAVKSYVLSMGGSIEVRSEPGHGMEVSLLLPLALALLEVLLFERGGAVYGVPLATVEEAVLVPGTLQLEGRPALEIRGRPLPVTDIAEVIGAQAPPLRSYPPALVISAGGRRAVVTCDALVGQAEVVVKPLGPLFGGVTGYLGTAILGDGRIALLVESAVLTRGRSRRAAAAAPAAAAVPAPAPPARPVVLVVEDSFTVRELQRSILETAGYPVVTARDGRDALRALGTHPDIALVITDLEMPELDGLGLTRAIRSDPDRSSLPVVVVTSHGSDEDRRQGIEAGADAYMVKRDFDQQALLATVERLAGR